MFDNAVLNSLALKFSKLANDVQARRFAMGDVVIQMLKISTMSTVVALLRKVVPDAKAVLGYAITAKTLGELKTMAQTFTENGGVFSPDLKHRLERADIEALDLTPEKAAALATAVATGKVRVKSVKAAAGKPEKVAKVLEALEQAEAPKPDKGSVEALIIERDRLVTKREELDARIKALNARINEKHGVAAPVASPKQSEAATPIGKPRIRTQVEAPIRG